MVDWEKINTSGIAKIERCVAEFNIWELKYSPYAKFKIKVFENKEGRYEGYTNLLIIDEIGHFYCALGTGASIEEALNSTLERFFEQVSWKSPREWTEEDFQCADSFDF